jgi:transposase-like protein
MKSTEEIIGNLRAVASTAETQTDALYCNEAADRLEELSKERAEMVQSLRRLRSIDADMGYTLRNTAEILGVSPVTLSKWTATEPTTEPDFVD